MRRISTRSLRLAISFTVSRNRDAGAGEARSASGCAGGARAGPIESAFSMSRTSWWGECACRRNGSDGDDAGERALPVDHHHQAMDAVARHYVERSS